jgi:hypothetical protein
VNFPDQKSWNGLVCPSNLAMVALVGFLSVGQATDWKIISRRPAKANAATRFGALKSEAPEQVVDRGGAVTNSSRIQRELD